MPALSITAQKIPIKTSKLEGGKASLGLVAEQEQQIKPIIEQGAGSPAKAPTPPTPEIQLKPRDMQEAKAAGQAIGKHSPYPQQKPEAVTEIKGIAAAVSKTKRSKILESENEAHGGTPQGRGR